MDFQYLDEAPSEQPRPAETLYAPLDGGDVYRLEPANPYGPPTGAVSFVEVLERIRAMHDLKQQDYGRSHDPFSNVRASEDFGVPAWVGALIRANDKMRRLQKAAAGGTLANESVWDSLIDLATYVVIATVLYSEEVGE